MSISASRLMAAVALSVLALGFARAAIDLRAVNRRREMQREFRDLLYRFADSGFADYGQFVQLLQRSDAPQSSMGRFSVLGVYRDPA